MPVTTRPKRVVHQKAKGPIDPGLGEKVRELRTARSMTQAQLAGPDFSKGFISLLETGRTRISLRAAHILAARLGVEVTDLLATPTDDRQDVEFMLLRAEQSLRAGDTKVATEIASAWTKRSNGVLRARFQRLNARALIESGHASDAVKLLDEAVHAFRSLGAKEFGARTLFDMARAHGRLGSTGESIRYSLEAEQAIQRGDVIDRTLELEIHQHLAGNYHALGDTNSARLRAERARAMAEDAADPHALANLYQSLALTRYEDGDKEAALAYARKAIDLFEAMGMRESVANTWITLAWLYLQQGLHPKAAEALEKAEQLADALDSKRLRGFVTMNRGALALARGDSENAREMAQEAADSNGPRLRARALLLKAKATAAGNATLPQVKKAFDEAIAAHKDEIPRERARAHQAYADALAARKQEKDAFAEARKALELIGPKY